MAKVLNLYVHCIANIVNQQRLVKIQLKLLITGVLSEHKLKERITLNWSCRGDLIYTGEDLDDHEYDLLCNSNNNSAAAAGSTLQAPSSSAAAVAGGSSAATDATVSSLQQAMLSTSIGKSSSQQTAASSR